MREMGKRLAAEGYSVLVPNPFYRVSKAPFTDASTFNFPNPADRAKLQPLMASVNAPGDARRMPSLTSLSSTRRSKSTSKKIGTQGYCMGGPLIMQDRRGAARSRWRRRFVPRRRPGDR